MSAILFIIFNRPDTTQRVFDSIRAEKPTRLYVAADAPRPNRPEDITLCAAARSIVAQIDWPCEVFTLFQERNLGCGKGVSNAISWFFEHEEEGIILEDDCLPESSFFPYCAELLSTHKGNPQIGIISGDNFMFNTVKDFSYHTTKYTFIWGWATWKSTWNLFSMDIIQTSFNEIRQSILSSFKHKDEQEYWIAILKSLQEGKINSWAYPFFFCMLMHGKAHIIPQKNLVSNIGFGNTATHTTDTAWYANLPIFSTGTLRHPIDLIVNNKRDYRYFRKVYLPKTPFRVKLIRFAIAITPKFTHPILKQLRNILQRR